MPTWDSAEADRLWEKSCGKERWHGALETVESNLRDVSDADLWQLRLDGRKSLVDYVRKRHVRQIAGRGAGTDELSEASQILDTDTLTLGFARRFATYKRPNLLLHDPERLIRILTNKGRPVQLVLAGKAHPQDGEGQNMIRQWLDFVRRPEIRPRAVFLADYDLLMAEHLVQGVDVWINTPRRPWEASGTSGMKVLVNGGLNLSELDGWWAEAYSPELGWALGDRSEHDDDPSWDAAEAEALYGIIEREVVPQFYERDEHGIPHAWVRRMRESMARLTPAFSTNRVVREYTERHYLPAAGAFAARAANGGAFGVHLLDWQKQVAKHWSVVRFGSASAKPEADRYFFQAQVFLDDLDPDAVTVELYAEGQNGGEAEHCAMNRSEHLVGSANAFLYTAEIPAIRPISDYTPRIVPSHTGAQVPLEAPFVVWHESPPWRKQISA
jgi:starch phosphorylase